MTLNASTLREASGRVLEQQGKCPSEKNRRMRMLQMCNIMGAKDSRAPLHFLQPEPARR